MEERDLNCSEEKSYYPIMADFATKVTKILLNLKSQILNLNCRANREQTKACFQYAEVQPAIKRSLNLKPQISNLKPQTSNLKSQTSNLNPQT